MARILAVLILILILNFLAGTVPAQSIPVICEPHEALEAKLKKDYGEIRVAMGQAGSSLFEVYASAEGTFTVLLTRPEMKGLSCIQGAGTDFVLTGKKFPKKGKPS